MEDDIVGIEREQPASEAAKGGKDAPNPPADRRSPPPLDEQVIARLWAEGYSPDAIARTVRKPTAIVYRILKRFQKRIIDGGGINLP